MAHNTGTLCALWNTQSNRNLRWDNLSFTFSPNILKGLLVPTQRHLCSLPTLTSAKLPSWPLGGWGPWLPCLFSAAAAAKSLQSCLTLCDPIDGSPPGCPWDSPGKNTGVGCHFLLRCMKVKSESEVAHLATPWTAAYQAPPSMGFFRQEHWSGVPLPSPDYFLIPSILRVLSEYQISLEPFPSGGHWH